MTHTVVSCHLENNSALHSVSNNENSNQEMIFLPIFLHFYSTPKPKTVFILPFEAHFINVNYEHKWFK
jgi:hypothetical protein